ncbi:MAG: tryptophan 2,3-dioxygenase, partial [Sphingomonadales bacterium]|nr:tryptophan 2,3-dioxygenase [Sphingomonadales bacterium]
FDIPEEVMGRDVTEKYQANVKVKEAWFAIYSDTEKYWDLYALAEKLMDFEHNFLIWRYHHLKTVERIIGGKMGTGGSSGLPYLAKGLEAKIFPELLDVRTEL